MITTSPQVNNFSLLHKQDLKAVCLCDQQNCVWYDLYCDVVIAGTLTVQLPSLCDTYSHLSTINNQEHCFIAVLIQTLPAFPGRHLPSNQLIASRHLPSNLRIVTTQVAAARMIDLFENVADDTVDIVEMAVDLCSAVINLPQSVTMALSADWSKYWQTFLHHYHLINTTHLSHCSRANLLN